MQWLWAINDMQPENGSISGACDSNHMTNGSLGSHRHVLHYGPQARRVIPTGSHGIKPVSTQSGPIQSVFLVWSCHQRQMARLDLVGDGGWQGSKVSMGTGVKQLLTAHWLSNKKEYEWCINIACTTKCSRTWHTLTLHVNYCLSSIEILWCLFNIRCKEKYSKNVSNTYVCTVHI